MRGDGRIITSIVASFSILRLDILRLQQLVILIFIWVSIKCSTSAPLLPLRHLMNSDHGRGTVTNPTPLPSIFHISPFILLGGVSRQKHVLFFFDEKIFGFLHLWEEKSFTNNLFYKGPDPPLINVPKCLSTSPIESHLLSNQLRSTALNSRTVWVLSNLSDVNSATITFPFATRYASWLNFLLLSSSKASIIPVYWLRMFLARSTVFQSPTGHLESRRLLLGFY